MASSYNSRQKNKKVKSCTILYYNKKKKLQ